MIDGLHCSTGRVQICRNCMIWVIKLEGGFLKPIRACLLLRMARVRSEWIMGARKIEAVGLDGTSEVDPGNGTSGLIGNGAVSVVVDGDDDEEAETED